MPELKTPEGKPVEAGRQEIDRDFAAAMASDPGDDEATAPPRKQAAAEEPPRKRGRPTKEEQARRAASAKAVTSLSDQERSQGVKGLVQLGAGVCLMAAKGTGNDAFRADAITIASNADEIADAMVQTARADARFAAALDKVCNVGPYAALLSVAFGVGSQIARNHRPGLALPNTMHPAEILRLAEEQEQQQQPLAA